MNCTACGTTLPEGALFCGECGRAVGAFAERPRVTVPAGDPMPAVAPPSARMAPVVASSDSEFSCPQCGEEIDEDDVFCGECGFVLAVSEPRPPLSAFAPDLSDAAPVRPGANDTTELEPLAAEPVVEEPAPVVEESAPVVEEPEPVVEESAPVVEEPVPVVESEPDLPEPAADLLEPVVEEPEPLVEDPEPVDDEPEPAAAVDPAPPVEFVAPVVATPSRPPAPLRKAPDPFPWGKDPRESSVDLEATRIVAGASAEERFVLQFSTGESVTVSGAGLVGRNPSSQPGEFVDQLVTIFDAGKSVSKTHLEFGQDAGRFWVSDRYSTNGSTVRQPDADPQRCEPGRRYFIARGTRVDIGEQFFVVS